MTKGFESQALQGASNKASLESEDFLAAVVGLQAEAAQARVREAETVVRDEAIGRKATHGVPASDARRL